MKLIFFAFKHRYRYKDLNNFLNSRFYGKYFLLNLGGPFKHFIARVLLKLKFGFAISCDARPLIENKKLGINFEMVERPGLSHGIDAESITASINFLEPLISQ